MQRLQDIQHELEKVQVLAPWGKKQDDQWDKASRFIYELCTYQDIEYKLNTLQAEETFRNYVWNRWYNFWSAKGIEIIFKSFNQVQAHPNPYHSSIDFYINNIPFDHKSTVYPKNYPHNLTQALAQPKALIQWLYTEQSQQQRFHLDNRLFIIFYDKNLLHWKLKSQLLWISSIVENYLNQFDPQKLIRIDFEKHKACLSDIIWCIKN